MDNHFFFFSDNIHYKSVQRIVKILWICCIWTWRFCWVNTSSRSGVVSVYSTVKAFFSFKIEIRMGLRTKYTYSTGRGIKRCIFRAVCQIFISRLSWIIISFIWLEIRMNQILSTFWCNKRNINTSVTIFINSLNWRTYWFVYTLSLNRIIILILSASWRNQNTLFSSVIVNLIICTVYSAFENSIVIHIACWTIPALTNIVVKIHASCTVCIDKLTNFSDIVIILTRFTISTKASRVIIILSRGTCNCLLFAKVCILIIHVSLRAGHTLTSCFVKVLVDRIGTCFDSSFTLLSGNVIKILCRASVQATMCCCIVIIIIWTKFDTFLCGLVECFILFA